MIGKELIMYSAIRYAMGRKTYVGGLYSDIAKEYYDILPSNALENASRIMLRDMEDNFRYGCPKVCYEGIVCEDERNIIQDIVNFINNKISSKEDLYKIREIVITKENYKKTTPKEYIIYNEDIQLERNFELLTEKLDDLINWYTLVKLFDKENHLLIETNYNGEIKTHECVETFEYDREVKEENNQIYYIRKQFQYKKCYKPVDSLKKGDFNITLNEEYITNIKKVDNGK